MFHKTIVLDTGIDIFFSLKGHCQSVVKGGADPHTRTTCQNTRPILHEKALRDMTSPKLAEKLADQPGQSVELDKTSSTQLVSWKSEAEDQMHGEVADWQVTS